MAAKSKGKRGKPAKDKTVAPKEKKYISVTPNNKISKFLCRFQFQIFRYFIAIIFLADIVFATNEKLTFIFR